MLYPIKTMLNTCFLNYSGVFNTAVYYLPSSQNMKAKGYNSILLTENTKQVAITTVLCSEIIILADQATIHQQMLHYANSFHFR